MKREEIYL